MKWVNCNFNNYFKKKFKSKFFFKGWTLEKTLAFIKNTKPDEYEVLIADTKRYIHCITLSLV